MQQVEIIDPQITPFSTVEEIQTWIALLEQADEPWSNERKAAIIDAQAMLVIASL